MATQKSGISPLRQRMIEDMRIRKFGEKTQSQNFRASLPSTSGAILTLPASQPKGVRDISFSHAFLFKKSNDSDPFVSVAPQRRAAQPWPTAAGDSFQSLSALPWATAWATSSGKLANACRQSATCRTYRSDQCSGQTLSIARTKRSG